LPEGILGKKEVRTGGSLVWRGISCGGQATFRNAPHGGTDSSSNL
jgi:hypothetical protein